MFIKQLGPTNGGVARIRADLALLVGGGYLVDDLGLLDLHRDCLLHGELGFGHGTLRGSIAT